MQTKINKKDFLDTHSLEFNNNIDVISIDFFKNIDVVVVWLNEKIISTSNSFTKANK